ncbi:distal tail protein Dit [Enterococcus gallinarum]|uniref:distal tail protein Dit n=1 Tax=Enterococcus gallinarum TaxID=1353 RepID=UPI001D17826C|nr:distal tail protein Dit [Enterococcus gallinarum]MCC4043750.1 phage tail family protein [Enterococcus gallinarum]
MITVTYAGYDITKYMIVTSLDRGLLPGIEYNTKKVGRSDGEKYVDRSIGRKTIPMSFKLRYDLVKKRRTLAEILAQKEPQPLIFSDEPDKCWYAIPTGDISVAENNFLGSGEINWIVPDGVSYDVNTRIFSNISIDSAENQVLDPEFRKKDKYYKQWTARLNETNGSHNILGADLSDTNTIADRGEIKYNGFYIMQNSNSTARNLPELKQGDKVWGRVALRIDKALQGDTNGSKSAVAVIQELDYAGGKVLASHEAKPAVLNLGNFQNLDIHFSISNPNTKALNLITCLALGSAVSYSKPQYNLGSELADYSEPNKEMSNYLAVTNPGTYKTWPILRATMNGENGLVGVVNQNEGILQFGNPEEIDMVSGVRTEKVISIQMRNNGDVFELNSSKAKPHYPYFRQNPDTPNIIGGTIDWQANPEGATPVFPTDNVNVWIGPLMYKEIPKNSSNQTTGNFEWLNRFNFKPTKIGGGRIQFTLQNNNGPVISLVVRDGTPSTEQLIVEFNCFNTTLKTVTLDRKKWNGSFWEMSISRTSGTEITFKFSMWHSFSGDTVNASAVEVFNINEPTLNEIGIDAMNIWFMKFGTYQPVTMDWTDTKFYWTNETVISNIPNLFDDGDILEIDTKNRRVSINGVENLKLHALGNTWERFVVEPGTTTFLPVASTWANMFDFEVELKGAYI